MSGSMSPYQAVATPYPRAMIFSIGQRLEPVRGPWHRFGTRFARLLAAEIPYVGRRDARVGVDRVVAVEVQAEKDGGWTVGFLGEIDEQIDLRPFAVGREANRDFFADGRAAQGVAIEPSGPGSDTPSGFPGALP